MEGCKRRIRMNYILCLCYCLYGWQRFDLLIHISKGYLGQTSVAFCAGNGTGPKLCGCHPYNFKPYRAFQFYFLPLAQFVVAAILLNLPFLKYFGSIVVATILLNLYEIFSVVFQFFYTYLDSLWLQSFFNWFTIA